MSTETAEMPSPPRSLKQIGVQAPKQTGVKPDVPPDKPPTSAAPSAEPRANSARGLNRQRRIRRQKLSLRLPSKPGAPTLPTALSRSMPTGVKVEKPSEKGAPGSGPPSRAPPPGRAPPPRVKAEKKRKRSPDPDAPAAARQKSPPAEIIDVTAIKTEPQTAAGKPIAAMRGSSSRSRGNSRRPPPPATIAMPLVNSAMGMKVPMLNNRMMQGWNMNMGMGMGTMGNQMRSMGSMGLGGMSGMNSGSLWGSSSTTNAGGSSSDGISDNYKTLIADVVRETVHQLSSKFAKEIAKEVSKLVRDDEDAELMTTVERTSPDERYRDLTGLSGKRLLQLYTREGHSVEDPQKAQMVLGYLTTRYDIYRVTKEGDTETNGNSDESWTDWRIPRTKMKKDFESRWGEPWTKTCGLYLQKFLSWLLIKRGLTAQDVQRTAKKKYHRFGVRFKDEEDIAPPAKRRRLEAQKLKNGCVKIGDKEYTVDDVQDLLNKNRKLKQTLGSINAARNLGTAETDMAMQYMNPVLGSMAMGNFNLANIGLGALGSSMLPSRALPPATRSAARAPHVPHAPPHRPVPPTVTTNKTPKTEPGTEGPGVPKALSSAPKSHGKTFWG